jgi:hypothetical protein
MKTTVEIAPCLLAAMLLKGESGAALIKLEDFTKLSLKLL